MNKYFYPIYKMKLKPWIKWWILKRLGGGQSSLKAVTLSSGTLTKVDKSKALSIKEYYGNTVQDGTPTPESPVEVQTISGNITFTINGGDYKLDLKGNVETEYSSSNPIELCKIGDYQDRIYKENDKWYIEKNTGKVVLNGSESWYYYTESSKPVFYLICEQYNISYKIQSGLICYSNYFIGKGQVNSFDNVYNLGNNVIAFRSSFTRLVIRNDSITSVDDFKTWLSTHNTTVYYVLATPTTETITNTNLISQLNALYEFYVNSSTVTISNNSEITLEVLLEYYGR